MFNELRNLKNQLLTEQRKALQIISHASRDCPAGRKALEVLAKIQADLLKLDLVKGGN